MDDAKLVWSDQFGDMRKKKTNRPDLPVDEKNLELKIRRLTTGKGRTVIEITGLPSNKAWCKKLAKEIKKALGVGGAFKHDFIEVHGEKKQEVMEVLTKKNLKFKQIGG